MGEGQHTTQVAAPRSLSDIRTDLLRADAQCDVRRVVELERELRQAADQATHLDGGRRGR